ncbi:uncharacterized protein LOC34624010 [Cyclospora cayetanensis]|uniref:Uncharacterized protein LOC34624010 n=1 Tax=Cyclospora cayetanensis TaxID=88456 RepID=A0A6P6RU38_9EIME|nr:uncharacterized protein LOC34624010 [Cyclospora cayetanensis]
MHAVPYAWSCYSSGALPAAAAGGARARVSEELSSWEADDESEVERLLRDRDASPYLKAALQQPPEGLLQHRGVSSPTHQHALPAAGTPPMPEDAPLVFSESSAAAAAGGGTSPSAAAAATAAAAGVGESLFWHVPEDGCYATCPMYVPLLQVMRERVQQRRAVAAAEEQQRRRQLELEAQQRLQLSGPVGLMLEAEAFVAATLLRRREELQIVNRRLEGQFAAAAAAEAAAAAASAPKWLAGVSRHLLPYVAQVSSRAFFDPHYRIQLLEAACPTWKCNKLSSHGSKFLSRALEFSPRKSPFRAISTPKSAAAEAADESFPSIWQMAILQ